MALTKVFQQHRLRTLKSKCLGNFPFFWASKEQNKLPCYVNKLPCHPWYWNAGSSLGPKEKSEKYRSVWRAFLTIDMIFARRFRRGGNNSKALPQIEVTRELMNSWKIGTRVSHGAISAQTGMCKPERLRSVTSELPKLLAAVGGGGWCFARLCLISLKFMRY